MHLKTIWEIDTVRSRPFSTRSGDEPRLGGVAEFTLATRQRALNADVRCPDVNIIVRIHMIQMRHAEDALHAFQTAWNSHNMESLGALFHEDATFVNRFGHYVRGVDAIIKLHEPIHATIYSDSTLENELIHVVAISNDVTVMHFWSRLRSGAAHPAGPHVVDTLILAVLTRRGDEWRIRALENVTLTDPRTGEAVLRDGRSS
jgi:uncharacterized protein (TIGR02246 family)